MGSFLNENCDFPYKNGDFPGKNGDFPGKNGDFPNKNDDFPYSWWLLAGQRLQIDSRTYIDMDDTIIS